MGVADLKLINRSLKELRYAAKVFADYKGVRKVAIFGSARTAPETPVWRMAEEFGREIVRRLHAPHICETETRTRHLIWTSK